ncbi:MAG: signal recognition particle-docking protein FtsY [Synergistales bacterium]|nr:signal recognition particle-docking protein FtsY [Synergistales bacterium]
MSLVRSLQEKLKGVTRSWSGGITRIFSGGPLDDTFWEELEEQLISGDVGVDLSEELLERLNETANRKRIKTREELYQVFSEMLVDMLTALEVPPEQRITADPPSAVLLVGVNGSGKTTTAGKLAQRMQNNGKSALLAAGDTYRAAAIEQLQLWGKRANVRVVSQAPGSDAAAVLYDALHAAISTQTDCVLADTAGRLHTRHNLMQELHKVYRVACREVGEDAVEVWLVLDTVMGQNGLQQAKRFNETLPISGLVLTKYDNTAKGGILLAIAQELHLPVQYIGIGEQVDDLQPFVARPFVEALLGRETAHGETAEN